MNIFLTCNDAFFDSNLVQFPAGCSILSITINALPSLFTCNTFQRVSCQSINFLSPSETQNNHFSALSNLTRFPKKAFVVIENISLSSFPQYNFDFFSTVLFKNVLDLLSRVFSHRFVFDEKAQCISLDGRSKHIEMSAFSKDNALV